MCHRLVLFFALLIPGTVFCNAFAEETPVPVKKLPFTVSKETTWLTGPLNTDGTVNYVKAINDKYSKGVTQENNAAVLLVQAFGPSYISDSVRTRTLKRLGIDKLPKKGDYFITYEEYSEKHAKDLSEEDREKQLDRAMRAPWNEKEYPLVAGWIKANEKPMKLIIQATKRPRHWMPMLSPGEQPVMYDVLVPSPGQQRDAAKCLAAYAMLNLKPGQVAIAFKNLESIFQLTSYQRDGATLIEFLVGLATHNTGISLAKQMAFSGCLDRSQLVELLKMYQHVKPFGQPVEQYQWDRMMTLDSGMVVIRQSPSSSNPLINTKILKAYNPFVDWDEVFKESNRVYDQLITAVHFPDYKSRSKALEEWIQKRRHVVKKWGVKYHIKIYAKLRWAKTDDLVVRKEVTDATKRWMEMFLSILGGASEIRDRGVTQNQINRIAIALTIYKLDHGQFPKQLDALSPKYLKVIPNDMFSGKPFIYRLTDKGFILYSVMTNGKDDGGINDDETDKDDFLIAEYPAKSE